jgi:tetratricopeptide (TPR) repeat protein
MQPRVLPPFLPGYFVTFAANPFYTVPMKFLNPRSFFFYFAISISFSCFSQTREIDSLKTLLRSGMQDTTRSKRLVNLSRQLADEGKTAEARLVAEEARDLSGKLGFDKATVKAYNVLAEIYSTLGEYQKEEEAYRKEYELLVKLNDRGGIAGYMHNIANVYRDKGQMEKSIDCYNKALEINKETGNKQWEAYNYLGLGGTYDALGDYPKSLEHYFKALKILEELKDESAICSVYGSIGSVFRSQGDTLKALGYARKKLSLAQKINNKQQLNRAYQGLYIIYSVMDSLDKAEQYVMRSMEISQETADKDGIATCYMNLGSIYKNRKKFDAALTYFKIALKTDEENIGNLIAVNGNIAATLLDQKKYAEALGYAYKCLDYCRQVKANEGIIECYQLLTLIYKKQNNGMKALEYYEKFVGLRDSTFNNNNSKKLLQAEMNFDFEKKTALAKAEQDKKDALAAEELKQQRMQRNYFITGFLVVLLLSGFIFRGYRQKQKANELITQQKKIVEEQKMLIEEKQKEVMDSIFYARRIQTALMTAENYIAKTLQRLMDRG